MRAIKDGEQQAMGGNLVHAVMWWKINQSINDFLAHEVKICLDVHSCDIWLVWLQ